VGSTESSFQLALVSLNTVNSLLVASRLKELRRSLGHTRVDARGGDRVAGYPLKDDVLGFQIMGY
jgi:hypothetical protein